MVLVITSDRVAQLRETLSAAVNHLPVILNCGLDIFPLFYYCIIVYVCLSGVHSSLLSGHLAASWKLEAEAPKQWAARASVEARQSCRVL
jgi:hypothetical protein